MYTFSLFSIAGTALFMVGVFTLWYSSSFLGRWANRDGASNSLESEKDISKEVPNIVLTLFLFSFILYTAVNAALLAVKSGVPKSLVLLLLTILISTGNIRAYLWEGKKLAVLLIDLLFSAIVIFGGVTMIWYWPW